MQAHPLNSHIYCYHKNLMLYQLPKNASTIMRLWGENAGWEKQFDVKNLKPEDRVAVVLRDPVQRYISAANMYLNFSSSMFTNAHPKWSLYLTEDQHFIKQHWFLDQARLLDRPNVDFFWFHNGVVQDIINYYQLDDVENQIWNESTNPVITAVNTDLLQEHYAEDYELIDSVKFINR